MSRSNSKPRRSNEDTFRCVTQRKSEGVEVKIIPNLNQSKTLKDRLLEAVRMPVKALVAARARIARSRQEHDDDALEVSVVAYVSAGAMKASPAKWKPFAEDPLWEEFEGHKPDPNKPQDHLGWAMKAVHGAKDKRGKDRANVHRGALQAKFDEGAAPEGLIAFVKREGGIDAAYRNALNAKKIKTGATTKTDTLSANESASNDSNEDDRAIEVAESSADSKDEFEADKALFGKIGRHLNAMKGRSIKPVLIGAPSNLSGKIVDRFIDAGEVNIRCTLTRKPDGWVDVTVTKVWRRSSKP